MHEYKCTFEQKKAHKHENNGAFLSLPSSGGGDRWTDNEADSRHWEHIVHWKPARSAQAAAQSQRVSPHLSCRGKLSTSTRDAAAGGRNARAHLENQQTLQIRCDFVLNTILPSWSVTPPPPPPFSLVLWVHSSQPKPSGLQTSIYTHPVRVMVSTWREPLAV